MLLLETKWGCSATLKGKKGKSVTLESCLHPPTFRLCSDFRNINDCIVQTSCNPPDLAHICDNFRVKGQKPPPPQVVQCHEFEISIPYHRKVGGFVELPRREWEFHIRRNAIWPTKKCHIFNKVAQQVLAAIQYLFVAKYADDCPLYLSTVDEHIEHMREVLRRYEYYSLKLNSRKCVITRTEVSLCAQLIYGETEALNRLYPVLKQSVGSRTEMRIPM